MGGVRWTIKDGVVYDAKQLLADVRQMVEQQKQDLKQPNVDSQPDVLPVETGEAGKF